MGKGTQETGQILRVTVSERRIRERCKRFVWVFEFQKDVFGGNWGWLGKIWGSRGSKSCGTPKNVCFRSREAE